MKLRPFVYAVARGRGEGRLERLQDWTADLCSAFRWWRSYGVWSVPTRRWQNRQPGRPNWPLPW